MSEDCCPLSREDPKQKNRRRCTVDNKICHTSYQLVRDRMYQSRSAAIRVAVRDLSKKELGEAYTMTGKRDYIILPLSKWFTGKTMEELSGKGFNVSVKPT